MDNFVRTKTYISYTQLVMWEKNPELYKQVYWHGKKLPINRGMVLGKEVADSLENDEETGDIEIDLVVALFPKYEIRDKEIIAPLLVGKGKDRHFIKILSKPDSTKSDYTKFYEYKTGSGPWTQKMVDNNDQMTFYHAGLYLKIKSEGGIALPTGELWWAPTEKRIDEDGVERPHLTGEIKRFPTSRTFVQILQMHARMATAWREIGEAMEAEII